MPMLNTDDAAALLRRVADKHGKERAAALKAVLSDPGFQDEVLIMASSTPEESARASLDLHGFLAGKLERTRLHGALRGTLLGLHDRLKLRSVAQEEVPARPMEAGLIEALSGLIRAKRAQPVKMANADFDLARLEEETATIETLRQVAQVMVRFTGTLLRNLAVREDAAVKVMRQAYGKVREASRADDALAEHLSPTETYLFGPAQEAAKTRGKMDAARREAFSAGE